MGEWHLGFDVRWADLDPNQHVRHTAYADYGTHVRMSWLASAGFDAARFEALRIGPVILLEQNRYLKEVAAGDRLEYDLKVAGASEDASRFRLRHEIRRGDGRVAARIEVEGGWMDLDARRLKPPPPELAAALRALVPTDDFERLEPYGSRRSRGERDGAGEERPSRGEAREGDRNA